MTLPEPRAPSELDAIEGVARIRTTSGWYRVLRRFEPRTRWAEEDGTARQRGLFVHVVATGRDPLTDAVIELAALPFEYAPADGQVYTAGSAACWLEDPGRPIPDAVAERSGITDEMVRGRRIDDARAAALLRDVSLVVAHGALTTRGFLERRLPTFAAVPWACSRTGVAWRRHGCSGTALERILLETCAELLDGRSGAERCHAGVHILATRTAAGELPLAELLER